MRRGSMGACGLESRGLVCVRQGVAELRVAAELLLEAAVEGRDADLCTAGPRTTTLSQDRPDRLAETSKGGHARERPTFCSAAASAPNVASQLSDFLCSRAATKALGATRNSKPAAEAL